MFGLDPEETDKAEEWAYFGEWDAPGTATSGKDLLPGYPAISPKKGDPQLSDMEGTMKYVNQAIINPSM
jgi:hypothetical protein